MKSRTIRLIAAWSVSSVSETRRDVPNSPMARLNVSIAALMTIAVSAIATRVSASVKPASIRLRIRGQISRQDERAGRRRRVVAHDHANLPERLADVADFDLTGESEVRDRDVVRRAKQAVRPRLDHRHQSAVVGGVDESVGAGILDGLRAVEEDAAVAARPTVHVADLRPRQHAAVARLEHGLGRFGRALTREQLVLRAGNL